MRCVPSGDQIGGHGDLAAIEVGELSHVAVMDFWFVKASARMAGLIRNEGVITP